MDMPVGAQVFARTTASPGSDLPPAWPYRSRYRATARGLIAKTTNPAARSAATSRPLSVSMAISIAVGSMACAASSRISCPKPVASLLTRARATTAASASTMATSW